MSGGVKFSCASSSFVDCFSKSEAVVRIGKAACATKPHCAHHVLDVFDILEVLATCPSPYSGAGGPKIVSLSTSAGDGAQTVIKCLMSPR